jgi:hypothetical protein
MLVEEQVKENVYQIFLNLINAQEVGFIQETALLKYLIGSHH